MNKPNGKFNIGFGFLFSLVMAFHSSIYSEEPVQASEKFLKYWKSGLGEISTYDITTERYGEKRKAQGVLVFVYEEINADTRIKVESEKTPLNKQIPILKLNSILKFNTGIYDYSVMTSVFAGLSGPGVQRHFEPKKISLSSQEWCGHVFHQLIPGKKNLVSEIHSYFEAEGDTKTVLANPKDEIYYEDEMPILIRELDGDFMAKGEEKNLTLVPSLWKTRKKHIPLAFEKATLTKVGLKNLEIENKTVAVNDWVLKSDTCSTTYHIEAEGAKKLLGWENNLGEKGVLIKSIRTPYWEKHGNKDEHYRKELGLKYGVGEGS